MKPTKSIAVVCGSMKFDGIFQTTQQIIETLRMIGFDVRAYQAVDPGHGFIHSTSSTNGVFKGIYMPFRNLEMGFNRLFVYPPRIGALKEDEILISDTSMVGSIRDLSRMTVRIQDIRPLTKYRDNYFTTLMFKLVIPRLRRAKHLIVDTELVKRQLVERGISGVKISVVSPVSNIRENNDEALKHIKKSLDCIKMHRPVTCLYVATDRPYKNISFFLKLAKRFSESTESTSFIFYLISQLKENTKRIIEELDLRNLVVLDSVDRMEGLYSKCDILVFPSLYEGFGIPIIEAMSRGIPVVTSNNPPMSDIVAKSGLQCGLDDIEDWHEKILMLSDYSLYSKYAYLSLQRYAHFDRCNFEKSLREVFDH